MTVNPLQFDPSRTTLLRRRFMAEFRRRFKQLAKELWDLVAIEDAFGVKPFKPFTWNTVNNQRWRFNTTTQKVSAFQRWLKNQVDVRILEEYKNQEDAYWRAYVEEGYRKGAGRAFEDVRKREKMTSKLDFYEGTRSEFLRSSFAQPETIEKVKLLAGRTLTDLQDVTSSMASRMSHVLTDGLVQGQNPLWIAREMTKVLDISIGRAERIARTEIIRAHAEGAIDAMERLGVEEVGVMVEWSTAGDGRVCPKCKALDGIVLTTKEAKGMFPRHPNCRCTPVPANVGESTRGQKRGQSKVSAAISRSLAAERRKGTKTSVAALRKRSTWLGAGKPIAKVRPNRIV